MSRLRSSSSLRSSFSSLMLAQFCGKLVLPSVCRRSGLCEEPTQDVTVCIVAVTFHCTAPPASVDGRYSLKHTKAALGCQTGCKLYFSLRRHTLMSGNGWLPEASPNADQAPSSSTPGGSRHLWLYAPHLRCSTLRNNLWMLKNWMFLL